MKLTLGQAAKQVDKSKPTLSEAIKKGRLSATKNEVGHYEIDPAELFRVYPKPSKPNGLDEQQILSSPNPSKTTGSSGNKEVLALLLAERDKLIAEKDKLIGRLEQEIENLKEGFKNERDLANKNILLLENKSEETSLKKTITVLEEQKTSYESQLNIARGKTKDQISAYRKKIDMLIENLEGQGAEISEYKTRFTTLKNTTLDGALSDLEAVLKPHRTLYRTLLKLSKPDSNNFKRKWLFFNSAKTKLHKTA